MAVQRAVPQNRAARRRFALWRQKWVHRPKSVLDGMAAGHRRFPLNEPLSGALAVTAGTNPPPMAPHVRGSPYGVILSPGETREGRVKPDLFP